jgi:hypothetical protein
MLRAKASPWPFVGMSGLAALLFLYLASGAFLPWWGVVLLTLLWLVLFAVGCRWFTLKPRGVVLLPMAGLMVFFGAVLVATLR